MSIFSQCLVNTLGINLTLLCFIVYAEILMVKMEYFLGKKFLWSSATTKKQEESNSWINGIAGASDSGPRKSKKYNRRCFQESSCSCEMHTTTTMIDGLFPDTPKGYAYFCSVLVGYQQNSRTSISILGKEFKRTGISFKSQQNHMLKARKHEEPSH